MALATLCCRRCELLYASVRSFVFGFFFSSRRRHTRCSRDWSSDVCSSDLYHFGPDGSVGGLRWAGITKYLARLGWEVSVITAAPPGGNGASGGAYVEWCPRLWTFLDGCRLLRRLAFGRSPGSFANGSRVVPGAELSGLLSQLRREVAALLAFPGESRGGGLRAALAA